MKRTGLACIACLLVATVALFILLGTSRATAQGVSLDEGTEFVVVFQKNFRDFVSESDRLTPAAELELSLVISSSTDATVVIEIPFLKNRPNTVTPVPEPEVPADFGRVEDGPITVEADKTVREPIRVREEPTLPRDQVDSFYPSAMPKIGINGGLRATAQRSAIRRFDPSTDASNKERSIPTPPKPLKKVHIPAGTTMTVRIDSSLQLRSSEEVSDKVIRISSDVPITVTGLSHRYQTTDAFKVLPVEKLGSRYRAAGYRWLADDLISQFAVVAVEDNTIVSITPSVRTRAGRPAGEAFGVRLDAGQAYQVIPAFDASTSSDLTGTMIESTGPVALFSGHNCAYVPENRYKACNILAEQIEPTDVVGQRFVVAPFAPQSSSILRIVADKPNTAIFLNEKEVASIDAGEFYELPVGSPTEIRTSEPAAVYGYGIGFTYPDPTTGKADSLGDPMMLSIPPVERFSNAYRIAPLESSGWIHHATIVVPRDGVGSVHVGSEVVTESEFTPVGTGEYFIAQIRIVGEQVVWSRYPIGVTVNGVGFGSREFDAYGFSAPAITYASRHDGQLASESESDGEVETIATEEAEIEERADRNDVESRQPSWLPIERLD